MIRCGVEWRDYAIGAGAETGSRGVASDGSNEFPRTDLRDGGGEMAVFLDGVVAPMRFGAP